ncbi:MAG: SbcC/MukB-like Walker B domain-containing protein, partial [Pseudonocardia sp.]
AGTGAAERLAELEPALAAAVAALAAVVDTPGLFASGGTADPRSDAPGSGAPADRVDDLIPFELARGFATGNRVPAPVLALARRLIDLPAPSRPGTETAVYVAWQDAASGPAGDCDPRVAEVGKALTVIGRDDAGEHPVGELAGRLAAAVARDAELLTDRERRLFEEHILGDLGESLRSRRLEAEELVTEMNQLLRGVTTSQGIAVQLRWTLRDDVAADARRAVDLLGRPVGALLPDERRDLRDALHRLIEASRVDAPEDSYSEHLARALDYRRWFAFRIRYTRPENAGTWHDLHRRSPLSQGEQKVVCYLPLFAAAAAHFSSLAGAAPHSPRFVLLDDAFPKIDVRTHPLLFGLLVQLDLDFVVTSERLWGDHATVPSLAIYEALRDPNERGIAQYRHLWDGHRLQAVGA